MPALSEAHRRKIAVGVRAYHARYRRACQCPKMKQHKKGASTQPHGRRLRPKGAKGAKGAKIPKAPKAPKIMDRALKPTKKQKPSKVAKQRRVALTTVVAGPRRSAGTVKKKGIGATGAGRALTDGQRRY